MREPRNGLRPVTVTIREPKRKAFEGYFHCFSQEGDVEEGIHLYATVELKDGRVLQIEPQHMKFEDVE